MRQPLLRPGNTRRRIQKPINSLSRTWKDRDRLLKQAREQVSVFQRRYANLYESAPVGYFTFSAEGRVLEHNQTGAELLAAAPDTLKSARFTNFLAPGFAQLFFAHLQHTLTTISTQTIELKFLRGTDHFFYGRLQSLAVPDRSGKLRQVHSALIDNTEQKEAQKALHASYRFLTIASSHSDLQRTLDEFIFEIRGLTDCSIVGVRMLNENGDIAYAAIEGIDEAFYREESTLNAHTDRCLCSLVINGALPRDIPYATGYGSFFTPNSSQMAFSSLNGTDGQLRGACMRYGLESLALIPIRAGGKNLGLIQVASLEKNRLSLKTVELLEKAAMQLGTNIQRVQAETALKKSHLLLEERVVMRTAELLKSNEKLRHEITKRTHIAKELRRTQRMLQSVFDGISDPLLLVSNDMQVRMLNQAAKHYFRLASPQTAIGRICHEISKPGTKSCERCRLPEAVRQGSPLTIERSGIFDPEREEMVAVYPVVHDIADQAGAVIRIHDITHRKQIEQQLIQSEKMASLGMLVSSVAHELNNPNSFIAFNIPILRDFVTEMLPILDRHAADHPDFEISRIPYPEFRQDVYRLLDNLEHGSQRINAFLSNLKEFVRNRPTHDLQWLRLNDVIERAVSICRSKIRKSVQELNIDVSEHLPPVYSDPGALEQIMVNLLVNAAEAADKPRTSLHVSAAVENGDDAQFSIEVADNGCGMDHATLSQIFDPFFSTKKDAGGTGLGLYICKNLVERLEGTLEVHSEPGCGSRFMVRLPYGKMPVKAGGPMDRVS